MFRNEWEKASTHASKGLQLFIDWGTSYDKRVPWESWIAWCRVMIENAKEKKWPNKPFGLLSLGLVK